MSIQSEINRVKQNVTDTYSVLSEMGATMPEEQNSDNLAATARTVTGGGGGSAEGAVLYTEQTLTEEQKEQARKNIGAVPAVVSAVGGDTLNWTAFTSEEEIDVSLVVADVLYPISDAVVTMADLSQGVNIYLTCEDASEPIPAEECFEFDEGGVLCGELFFAIAKAGATFEDEGMTIVFPKAGLYAAADILFLNFSLTINGYTGFGKKETLDPAYLPVTYLYTNAGDPSDIYLYTDAGLSEKVTMEEFEKRADTIIRVKSAYAGWCSASYTTPILVNVSEELSNVQIAKKTSAIGDDSLERKVYYVAEYTPTT